ncbi:MAG: YncE family protein [Solirubrobacteraceae bacterium]
MNGRRAWRSVLVLVLALTAACGGQAVGSQAAARAPIRLAPSIASEAGTRDYEYVFVDDAAYVYDMNNRMRLVQKLSLPGITTIRGVGVDLSDHMLYISYGGDGGWTGDGSLAAYDLVARRVAWTVSYRHGVDSFAISSDGTRIYLPDGERSSDGNWWVLNAADGATIGRIRAGLGPHNTIVGLDGRYVYMGGRNYRYLEVASTATNRVVRRIGPLYSGVRPFTINGRQTLAFTTATGFLGFQVSSIRTGRVLYTERFGRRFPYNPSSFPLTDPSHGISLSPNERRLWVLDTPNSYVHVFDVSGLPSRRPREIANIPLTHNFLGGSDYCSQDCERDGWLQNSLNGCYVFVGNSGDVLSAVTMRRVGYLPAMYDSREMVEIDWRGGVPVATSTKSGLGYVTGGYRPPRAHCPRG